MGIDIQIVREIISSRSFITKVDDIKESHSIIIGGFSIFLKGLPKPLKFSFQIFPTYPFKNYESESIKFINEDLLKYNHVMGDGSICIHTTHHHDYKKKLIIDLNSLSDWVLKYYINKEDDLHYEHIIVSADTINDKFFSYLFTDVDHKFKKGDFGQVELLLLNNNIFKEKKIENSLVKSFSLPEGKKIECQWSEVYKKSFSKKKGLYIYTESPPAIHDRFAVERYSDLQLIIPETFIEYLSNQVKELQKIQNGIVPLFIGHKTIQSEIHWQVALIESDNIPIKQDYKEVNKIVVPSFKLSNQNIKWAITNNSSYKYFYGRGTISSKITDSKILIIGIGAIGSILAKTLVKNGAKYIDIADYDIKNPENVCRSEYSFSTGITDKVYELKEKLLAESPFVEVEIFKNIYFEELIKTFSPTHEGKEHFSKTLNNYDIVFDCTTDNDLMYLLDLLNLSCNLINLSVTNHSETLVCAFYPNIYHFVDTQFKNFLKNDIYDLYKPTGCWSPTFKACYTDISLLIQIAVKQIDYFYKKDTSINNFIIKSEINDTSKMKVITF